jgi:hypothetical protein
LETHIVLGISMPLADDDSASVFKA